ncbi:MAG: hypothetical protein RLZZ58_617 [Pseudomonadota bacterium]|jgi:putative membrane protein
MKPRAKILTLDDHDRVTAAVAFAEGHTSGEIATVVAGRSSRYADIALWWALGIGLLALAVVLGFADFYRSLAHWAFGDWGAELSPASERALLFFFVVAKAGGTWVILLWRPLRLWLTPRAVKRERVRQAAIDAFRVGVEARTTGRTGVVVYLSMDEHMAEIVADAAIHGKVADAVWGDAMVALVDAARDGRPGDGIVAAVRQIGAILADHFPLGAHDHNELPDRLVEL